MKISIVTLNFNGSKETLELLKSLEGQTDKNFEIVIVDNASEEVIHIPTRQVGYPQVEIVRNSENLGFSGGNNVGIHQALNPSTRSGQETGSDWVVLLNNDTWVERDFIERLKSVLSVKGGVVGIPLIEGDPALQQVDAFSNKNHLLSDGASRVAYCGKIQWLKHTLSHIYSTNYQLKTKNYYAIGGAIAVHKNVFDKIGFLDEKYFLYFEDADFSIRAKKANIPVEFLPEVKISHSVSSSTKKLGSAMLLRYHYRNALYFNLKNGPWYIKILVWPWSCWIVGKQVLKLAAWKNREQSKAILNGVIDFYFNKMGIIKPRHGGAGEVSRL